MHEVRAEPLDHWTRSAGIEAGEVCQRTSHSPRLRGVVVGGEAAKRFGVHSEYDANATPTERAKTKMLWSMRAV